MASDSFTWVTDAPTGVYKNHQMSSLLRYQAMVDCEFANFARDEPGYGRGQGESITITRVKQLAQPTSVVLSETMRMPEDQISINTIAATVQEIGRAVSVTNFAKVLSKFDLEEIAQRLLRDQLKWALDTLCATAFKTTQIKYVPTGASSSTVTTNGTPGATASANMNVYHVEEIRQLMYDTYTVPYYEGSDYIGIFRGKGLLGIRRDTAWTPWHQYTTPQAKFNSETGKMESIRFVETNNPNALGLVGTSSVLGEGVVFGDDAVRVIMAQDPELRARPDVQDYGRSWGVAWYGILKYLSVWGDSANRGEARIVHVTSA